MYHCLSLLLPDIKPLFWSCKKFQRPEQSPPMLLWKLSVNVSASLATHLTEKVSMHRDFNATAVKILFKQWVVRKSLSSWKGHLLSQATGEAVDKLLLSVYTLFLYGLGSACKDWEDLPMDIQSVNIWESANSIQGIKMCALENTCSKTQSFLQEAANVMRE